MAGSDVPFGGCSAPPRSPERPRKCKRGAADEDEDEDAAAASTRRATRSSPLALVDVGGAVAWARRVAEGALWSVRGRNRGIDDDEERLGPVILALRHVRSQLEPDDPNTPYSKKRLHRKGTRSSGRITGGPSFLVSTRKHIGIDPVQCQASVPEWVNAPSEKDKADYKTDNETLQKMGTVVKLPYIVEPRKTRKAGDGKCRCSHPGSEACVGVHVKEAWKRVKYQLGDKAFRDCGLNAMGEQVLKLWTAEDKEKLADIEKLIPQNNHENFMKIALKHFSSERTMDLAKYYYNIFLPRRLASLTRAEATNTIDVSTDDEGNNQEDGNNEHRSEEKRRSSGFSSKRHRK